MKNFLFILMCVGIFAAACQKETIPQEWLTASQATQKNDLMSHTYEFTEGWQSLSFFLQTDNDSIAVVLEPIQDKIIIVKSINKVYWPAQGIDQLGEVDFAAGYIMKLSGPCTLTVEGVPVENIEQPLQEGWQMMGVPYATPQPVEEIFPISTSNDYDIVKEAITGEVYWPSQGINNIGEVQPGKSYLVHIE